MSRASNLYRLQDLDLTISQYQSRLSEIETILSDTEILTRAKIIFAEAKAKYQASQKHVRSAERLVQTQRNKIEKSERTLYGGVVNNPKELQDLQKEAASLKRYLSTLEDRLLDAMVTSEEAELQQQASAKELDRVTTQVTSKHNNLNAKQQSLQVDLQRLETEREAALVSINPDDLNLYQNLRQRVGNIAISLIQDGSCSACGLAQADSVQQAIRSGTELVRCGQCGRILYAG